MLTLLLPHVIGKCPTSRARRRMLRARRRNERRSLKVRVTLIQRAALQPGGQQFRTGNQEAEPLLRGDFSVGVPARSGGATAFWRPDLPAPMIKNLENRNWNLRDTRHIEDCMMYYGIATRVAGTGEDHRSGAPDLRLGGATGSARAARHAWLGPVATGFCPAV